MSLPRSLRFTMATRVCAAVAVAVALTTAVRGHGMTVIPRIRGALKCERNVDPSTMADDAVIDYCSHCLNAGGTDAVGAAGPWSPYAPMECNTRGGFGVCGDPVGSDDHMKTGKYANPPSMPFVEDYSSGGVANFAFDATANHGGYLEFYLCDVENNPNQDIQLSSFAHDCHYLKRVKHDSCESGNDKDCGPVDPKFPGRWVLPCRIKAGDQGDQILGGEDGKMAYQIPEVNIKVGVIHSYWATINACTPGPFMNDYNYPDAWSGCAGDGGAIGGKPQHHDLCTDNGGIPEEFWGCSDVTVGGGGGSDKTPTTTMPETDDKEEEEEEEEEKKEEPVDDTKPEDDGADEEDKNDDFKAVAVVDDNEEKTSGNDNNGGCVADGEMCAGKTCCSTNASCERVANDGKTGEVCKVGNSDNSGGSDNSGFGNSGDSDNSGSGNSGDSIWSWPGRNHNRASFRGNGGGHGFSYGRY